MIICHIETSGFVLSFIFFWLGLTGLIKTPEMSIFLRVYIYGGLQNTYCRCLWWNVSLDGPLFL
jgi:hypothetical protein